MPRRRTGRNPSSRNASSGHPSSNTSGSALPASGASRAEPARTEPDHLAPARRDLDSLRELVALLPPGLVGEEDRSDVQHLLFTAWLAFEGPGRGRSGVIHDPVELRWDPPVLHVTVRHFAWRHLDSTSAPSGSAAHVRCAPCS